MNEQKLTGPDRLARQVRRERRTLYRWWRAAIVRTVRHEKVLARIVEESRWSPRFVFMTMMSGGIAVLGLLLSSPAVVIGAMLISPLMGPILGLGFSLALFDFVEMRRSLTALAIGSLAAVAFTMLIVMVSPLTETTVEILSRTRPSLFDLMVALFAALAGTFAIIRGRGETIVGVAIATALMPPLAVMGFGVATWNLPVLAGSSALFITNFVTIALAAMILARFYGFGHHLSKQQSWAQTVLLFGVFVAMAVPLGLSLEQIARESIAANQIRKTLGQRFGPNARVTQLEIDFDANPLLIRSVIIAPRTKPWNSADLREQLETSLGRSVRLELDQVLLAPGADALDAQRAELRRASEDRAAGQDIAAIVSVVAGVDPARIMIDHDQRRVMASASVLPGATLDAYWMLERRATAAANGWDVVLIPPLSAMPEIRFADESDALDEGARRAVLLSAWAAARWNIRVLAVPGLAATADGAPDLSQRRASAIAAILREQEIEAVTAAAAGPRFRLAPASLPQER